MNIHADKQKKNKSRPVATTHTQKKDGEELTSLFVDNRPEAIAQRELQEIANNSPQAKQAAQLQSMADNHAAKQQQPIQKKGAKEEGLQVKFDPIQKKELEEAELLQGKFAPIQKKENDTGLPDNLKTGMENLSGMSLDDVKVHHNSNKPAQLQAHAYAQGTDIHLGPGQEKHLPHETWHVVQQKQGRVKPTMQMKGKVNVNDDSGLEREADVMGAKALQSINNTPNRLSNVGNNQSGVFQLNPYKKQNKKPVLPQQLPKNKKPALPQQLPKNKKPALPQQLPKEALENLSPDKKLAAEKKYQHNRLKNEIQGGDKLKEEALENLSPDKKLAADKQEGNWTKNPMISQEEWDEVKQDESEAVKFTPRGTNEVLFSTNYTKEQLEAFKKKAGSIGDRATFEAITTAINKKAFLITPESGSDAVEIAADVGGHINTAVDLSLGLTNYGDHANTGKGIKDWSFDVGATDKVNAFKGNPESNHLFSKAGKSSSFGGKFAPKPEEDTSPLTAVEYNSGWANPITAGLGLGMGAVGGGLAMAGAYKGIKQGGKDLLNGDNRGEAVASIGENVASGASAAINIANSGHNFYGALTGGTANIGANGGYALGGQAVPVASTVMGGIGMVKNGYQIHKNHKAKNQMSELAEREELNPATKALAEYAGKTMEKRRNRAGINLASNTLSTASGAALTSGVGVGVGAALAAGSSGVKYGFMGARMIKQKLVDKGWKKGKKSSEKDLERSNMTQSLINLAKKGGQDLEDACLILKTIGGKKSQIAILRGLAEDPEDIGDLLQEVVDLFKKRE